MDKYASTVQRNFKDKKNGLTSHTNVENMVSCVTKDCLLKYTASYEENSEQKAMNAYMKKY